MDVNQLAQMIEWLDEERRNDKTTIATLEERLSQQADTINQLQRRINGVESDQTVLKESSLSVSEERDLLETARREMRQLLENSEARRLTAEREAERRSDLSREQLLRNITELSDRVERLQKSTGSITEVKSEGSRVADTVGILQQRVDDLARKLDEPERRLAFLEEQRRQDARRITESEAEFPEMKKQIDTIRPKLTLIEDLSIRNERRIQEMQNSDRERREQMQQFIDSQNLILQQQESQIESLIKRFSEHDTEMQANMDRFEVWAQAYRDMKRIIEDFERIGDRLERRINEVAEMQRLSEERFRQEWNNWRDDDQKRWKQLTLSQDEVWRNHDKEFGRYVERIDDISEQIPQLRDNLNRMWQLERERARLYREHYQTLLLEHDPTGTTTMAPVSVQGDTNTNGTTENGTNGTNGTG